MISINLSMRNNEKSGWRNIVLLSIVRTSHKTNFTRDSTTEMLGHFCTVHSLKQMEIICFTFHISTLDCSKDLGFSLLQIQCDAGIQLLGSRWPGTDLHLPAPTLSSQNSLCQNPFLFFYWFIRHAWEVPRISLGAHCCHSHSKSLVKQN